MLKIIILILLGVEIFLRLMALKNDTLRNNIAAVWEENALDFRLNGSKSKMSLALWITFFVLILIC